MDFLTAAMPSFNADPLNPCAPVLGTAAMPSPPLEDAWTAVHGDWPLGITFPAVLGGNSNDPSRPDRVLVRGHVHACAASLIAADRGPALSDHYGVAVLLAL